jgi:tetratricopeptide (TPR) repeat protein
MLRRILALVTVGGILLAIGSSARLTAQATAAPLTEDELVQLVKQSRKHLPDVVPVLQQRGVDFDLNEKTEKKLRGAGADDDFLQEVWKAGPSSRNQKATVTTVNGTEVKISPKEGMAFHTIQDELDPGRRISMVTEFERQFPNSGILPQVYAQGAKACQEKNDLDGALQYGEKSLKLDPENVPSLVVVALTLSQPRMLNGDENEKNARLAEAENDASHVLKLVEMLPKQGSETDEDLQVRRKSYASDAHFSLGMVHLMRDDSEKAVTEFNAAISSAPRPNPQYYFRLGEVYANDGKKTEAIDAFRQAAAAGHGTVMEEYANRKIQELQK